MKKTTLAIFCFVLCGMFVACGDKTEQTPEHPDSTLTISDEILPEAVEETELDNNELPEMVLETIEYQYTGSELQDVVEMSNGIEKEYKITIKHRGEKKVLYITESGKILIK